jgi:4-hydroxyproline epimerase
VVALADGSQVTGDIAWGGNWFFLCDYASTPIALPNLPALLQHAQQIRAALETHGITGEAGTLIDHIELTGSALPGEIAHARNFVLCPGGAYDRSPCGTGTSAKLACLAAAGQLQPGQTWRQASLIGSVFEASYTWLGTQVKVSLVGSAYVNAEADLIIDPQDPFCMGIPV